MNFFNGENYRIYMYYPLPTTGKVEDENFDFFLDYDGRTYLGTVFSIKNMIYLMNKENEVFFYSQHSIFLFEISIDALKASIEKLIKNNEINLYLVLQSSS